MTTKFSLPRRLATLAAVLTLGLSSAAGWATSSHPLPLWRVSDGHGHLLYLAGSMHALSTDDYPLPKAFATVFNRADILIEELDLNAISPQEVKKAIQSYALLPADKTLAETMGEDWNKAQTLAAKAGVNLAQFKRYKPWFAAVRITAKRFMDAGYVPTLGLDQHFSRLAQQRKIPSVGLETLSEQLGFFDSLKPATQRQFLLQTLEGLPQFKQELEAMHAAWRLGNIEKLNDIAQKDFAKYPQLRKQLLQQRNRSWVPRLERCLSNGKTCFVVVGAEHMAGEHGLIALLSEDGYRVEQLSTALAPPSAATTPSTSSTSAQ